MIREAPRIRSPANLMASPPADVTAASCRAAISAAPWAPDVNATDHCTKSRPACKSTSSSPEARSIALLTAARLRSIGANVIARECEYAIHMRHSPAWPRLASGGKAANMRSMRSRHSPISDNVCQMGANAAVSLAPISASPSGENAQSSAARTLSSSRLHRATSSRLNQALEPATTGETTSRKYSAWRRAAAGYSPFSVSFSNA